MLPKEGYENTRLRLCWSDQNGFVINNLVRLIYFKVVKKLPEKVTNSLLYGRLDYLSQSGGHT